MPINVDTTGLGDPDGLFRDNVNSLISEELVDDGHWERLEGKGACEFILYIPKIKFGNVPLSWISGDVDAAALTFAEALIRRTNEKSETLIAQLAQALDAENLPECGLRNIQMTNVSYTDKKTNVTKYELQGQADCRVGFVDSSHTWIGGSTTANKFKDSYFLNPVNWSGGEAYHEDTPVKAPRKSLKDKLKSFMSR